MSTYVSVVISPATTATPVVTSVSQATRPAGSSCEDGVEHRVGDLVGDLVGMSLGDGLRGEETALGHVFSGRGDGVREWERARKLPPQSPADKLQETANG
jgi:hypothetical protein